MHGNTEEAPLSRIKEIGYDVMSETSLKPATLVAGYRFVLIMLKIVGRCSALKGCLKRLAYRQFPY